MNFLVSLLLSAQAKLKVTDSKKNYPIHIACEVGNVELVELILEKGGKTVLELCNDLGETPMLICCRQGLNDSVIE